MRAKQILTTKIWSKQQQLFNERLHAANKQWEHVLVVKFVCWMWQSKSVKCEQMQHSSNERNGPKQMKSKIAATKSDATNFSLTTDRMLWQFKTMMWTQTVIFVLVQWLSVIALCDVELGLF